jgi:hypothetical protein
MQSLNKVRELPVPEHHRPRARDKRALERGWGLVGVGEGG